MSTSIVFHHPHPVGPDGTSGSQVRPYRMLQAFRELGYDVELAAGYGAERRRSIRRIMADARRGRDFAFVYAESSTMPALLTEPHHLPTNPLLDAGFFRWAQSGAIPVGLFYRDVHWRFENYRRQVAWYKRAVAVQFYRHEWRQYGRWADHLFLPSAAMIRALPSAWPANRLTALPPGCDPQPHPAEGARAPGVPLRLFYVGGVTPPLYDLREMVGAVQALTGVVLTLCCRRAEWERASFWYPSIDASKVKIVHEQGDQLTAHYREADAFLLGWKPYAYLEFAMPVKVFEALGHGVPVVTAAGTAAGRFVDREGIGWIASSQQQLPELLARLRDDPRLLMSKRAAMLAAQTRHSWRVRAESVADVLLSYRDRSRSSSRSSVRPVPTSACDR